MLSVGMKYRHRVLKRLQEFLLVRFQEFLLSMLPLKLQPKTNTNETFSQFLEFLQLNFKPLSTQATIRVCRGLQKAINLIGRLDKTREI